MVLMMILLDIPSHHGTCPIRDPLAHTPPPSPSRDVQVIEKREEIDWRRNTAFAAFGFAYLGGVQYMLYVPVFGRLFPDAARFAAKTVAEKLRDAPGIRSLFSQVSE
jgi:hypothetical protein